MFARFDENPAMTLRVIKETKRYGQMDNVKTVHPLQTKFAGGIKNSGLTVSLWTDNEVQALTFNYCKTLLYLAGILFGAIGSKNKNPQNMRP